MCLTVGGAYGIPSVALRFFNIYGPRQALSNPYTGVLAIFASRYLNGKPPLVYEDGQQRRDFVHVSDVARACRLALERPGVEGEVFNVGSGDSITVLEVAAQLAQALGIDGPQARLTGEYRVGDIRHCFADIAHARSLLGYAPQVPLSAGLQELVDWMTGQSAFDRVDDMRAELARRGLQR
jgi:dTDP-L-rhamnose 4-epimerase